MVVRLRGEARVSDDDGKTWRPLQLAATIKEGDLLQTAAESLLYVQLGKPIYDIRWAGPQRKVPYNPESIVKTSLF